MAILGLVGIIIALALFLILVYKGWSAYWVAPVCAVIVALFNWMKPAVAINAYVGGMVDLVASLFYIIFMGAVLGKIYNDSGAATSIAQFLTNKLVIKRKGDAQVRMAILVIAIVSALLTMGGIDGYVLAFTMVPICFVMCEMLDIPRRFIGGMMTLNCAFMACPGAPQIDNVMAQAGIMSAVYSEGSAFTEVAGQTGFHVGSAAALIPGIISTAIIVVGGYFVLVNYILKAKHNGEHFEWGPCQKMDVSAETKKPNFFVALVPLIVVFAVYTVLPAIFHFEQQIAIALGLGIIAALVLMGRYLPNKEKNKMSLRERVVNVLNQGANSFPNALLTVITPAALAGVITATAAFGMIVGKLSGLQMNPMLLCLVVVCVLVAITSSPPAALMIAMPMVMNIMLGHGYTPVEVLDKAPALMRIGAIASSTFETLPFNGLIVLTLGLTGCTHKEAYKPMFMQSVVFTLIGAVVATVLLMLFPALG